MRHYCVIKRRNKKKTGEAENNNADCVVFGFGAAYSEFLIIFPSWPSIPFCFRNLLKERSMERKKERERTQPTKEALFISTIKTAVAGFTSVEIE